MIIATVITSSKAEIIGDAVRSLEGGVDRVLLLDVGIDDSTVAVAQDASTVPVDVVDGRPWVNCAHARQAALEAAHRAGGTWAVTLDTDERLEWHGEDLRAILAATAAEVVLAWAAEGTYAKERAIRLPARGSWTGRVHEAYAHEGVVETFGRLRFGELPKSGAQLLARLRNNDLPGLASEIAEHPEDSRWHYYLGQTWESIARLEDSTEARREALAAYVRCADLPGHRMQSAWACYRAAECWGLLGDWLQALYLCTQGFYRYNQIVELYCFAGLACMHLGRPSEALAWARAAETILALPNPLRNSWQQPSMNAEGPSMLAAAALEAMGQGYEARWDAAVAESKRAKREAGR